MQILEEEQILIDTRSIRVRSIRIDAYDTIYTTGPAVLLNGPVGNDHSFPDRNARLSIDRAYPDGEC